LCFDADDGPGPSRPGRDPAVTRNAREIKLQYRADPGPGTAYGFIRIGTGGRGARWCRNVLPPDVEAGLVEPVAAADVDADALENAREGLDLPEKRLTPTPTRPTSVRSSSRRGSTRT